VFHQGIFAERGRVRCRQDGRGPDARCLPACLVSQAVALTEQPWEGGVVPVSLTG